MSENDLLNKIKKLQKETADALSLVWQKGSVSFSGLHDISASLKRLEMYKVILGVKFI